METGKKIRIQSLILTITALLLALVTIKQLVADDSSSSDIQTFTFESSSKLLNWLGSRDRLQSSRGRAGPGYGPSDCLLRLQVDFSANRL